MPNLGLKARSRQVCLGGRRRLFRGGTLYRALQSSELARRIEEAGFISSSKAYCHDRSTNSSCSPWRMRRGQGWCGGTTSSTRSLPTSRTRSSTQWAPDGAEALPEPYALISKIRGARRRTTPEFAILQCRAGAAVVHGRHRENELGMCCSGHIDLCQARHGRARHDAPGTAAQESR